MKDQKPLAVRACYWTLIVLSLACVIYSLVWFAVALALVVAFVNHEIAALWRNECRRITSP